MSDGRRLVANVGSAAERERLVAPGAGGVEGRGGAEAEAAVGLGLLRFRWPTSLVTPGVKTHARALGLREG
jgi:hypothetical protein